MLLHRLRGLKVNVVLRCAGDCSSSISDCRVSGACLSLERNAGAALANPKPGLQQQYSDTTSGSQSHPLNVATSTAEGLAKDVVITQSVQLKEASDRGNRMHLRSPSTTSSIFSVPHTCPAALQGGIRNSGLSPRLQPGESGLPFSHGQTFGDRTPSPTTKLGFPRSPNFPQSSSTSKWRKAAQLTSKVCAVHQY